VTVLLIGTSVFLSPRNVARAQASGCKALSGHQKKQCRLATAFRLAYPLGAQSYVAQTRARRVNDREAESAAPDVVDAGQYGPYGYSRTNGISLRRIRKLSCGRKCRKRKRILRKVRRVTAAVALVTAAVLAENAGEIVGQVVRSATRKKGRKRRRKARKGSRKKPRRN
jgi:hypothetical protein